MDFKEIAYSLEEGLARVVLNRPQKVNSLSELMVAELSQVLDHIAADPQARVVLLSAAGKHFCAGHLLDEMVDRSPAEYRRIFSNCTAMMTKLSRLPQPVVVQVQGVATAAGCQLVAACDLAVAADTARFATPGVKIGLFCGTPSVPLVRAVGRKRALEMLLTGRFVSASEAAEWGLVNKVTAPAELSDETEKLAREIAQASPLTLTMGKQLFYEQVDRAEPEAYNLATSFMALNLTMEDAQEGIKAFIQKRQPTWKGC
ncbi:MAG: enoyl-CoA hydratase [Desulfarculaceae bacterium]|jgi:enoyl-CoA hydratase/carnithine racemase